MKLDLRIGGLYRNRVGRVWRLVEYYYDGRSYSWVGVLPGGGHVRSTWTATGAFYDDKTPAKWDLVEEVASSVVVDPADAISTPVQISTGAMTRPAPCQHRWIETPGLYRLYRDCALCKAKHEDVYPHGVDLRGVDPQTEGAHTS